MTRYRISMDQDNLRVNLEIFEGPLDLLLHLIKKNDLNIYDIPIALVLTQYLHYLSDLKEFNIDLAGDFLVMASELARIKSALLIQKKEEEEIEEPDPRESLVARLLEYQKYKRAKAWLLRRPLLNRDVFLRADKVYEEEMKDSSSADYGSVSMDSHSLIRVFQTLLKKMPFKQMQTIQPERVSVTERIYEILDILREKETAEFGELFKHDRSRLELVVTFLAVLEMARTQIVFIVQVDPKGSIWVKRNLEIQEDVLKEKVSGQPPLHEQGDSP